MKFSVIIFSFLSGLLLINTSAADNNLPERIMSMGEAQYKLSYQGALVYSRNTDMASYQIQHAMIKGKEYMKMSRLNGPYSEIIQSGQDFYCLHKNQDDINVTEFSQGRPQGFTLKPALIARAIRYYDIKSEGKGTIAGRSCDWVRLEPMHNDRLTHKFCIDAEYNFALSSEMYAPNAQLLEKMTYIDIHFDTPPKIQNFSLNPQNKIIKKVISLDNKTALPIQLKNIPAGFEHISSKQRSHPKNGMINTYLYSDGFSSFTLFIENISTENKMPSKAEETDFMHIQKMGSSTMISRSFYDSNENQKTTKKISVLGELPEQTLRQILRDIQAL